MKMGRGKRRKRKFKINFIRVEGDPVDVIANILEANVCAVLTKYGASSTVDLREMIRNHIKEGKT